MKGLSIYLLSLFVIGMLAIVTLSGCTPTTVIKPQVVDVPVAASCVPNLPPEPSWQAPTLNSGDHAKRVKALAHDLALAKGYIKQLQAALRACK